MLSSAKGADQTWLKLVIPANNRFHLLLLIIAVEWSVTTEEEIGNNTHSPDIHRLVVTRCKTISTRARNE